MRRILLSSGLVALVDDADFKRVSKFKWSAGTNYVVTETGGVRLKMHHLLLRTKPGEEVDHRNGNPFDNRRSNLRKCTRAQNLANRRVRKDSVSGVKGVRYVKARGVFHVRLRGAHIGSFKTLASAVRAHQKASKAHYGEFAFASRKR